MSKNRLDRQPHAPDVFADGATGFFHINGNIRITFESARAEYSTSPGPIHRIVNGRLVMPVVAAEAFAKGLLDFIQARKAIPQEQGSATLAIRLLSCQSSSFCLNLRPSSLHVRASCSHSQCLAKTYLTQYRQRGHPSAMTGENTGRVGSYPPDRCGHSDPHPLQGDFFNGTVQHQLRFSERPAGMKRT